MWLPIVFNIALKGWTFSCFMTHCYSPETEWEVCCAVTTASSGFRTCTAKLLEFIVGFMKTSWSFSKFPPSLVLLVLNNGTDCGISHVRHSTWSFDEITYSSQIFKNLQNALDNWHLASEWRTGRQRCHKNIKLVISIDFVWNNFILAMTKLFWYASHNLSLILFKLPFPNKQKSSKYTHVHVSGSNSSNFSWHLKCFWGRIGSENKHFKFENTARLIK